MNNTTFAVIAIVAALGVLGVVVVTVAAVDIQHNKLKQLGVHLGRQLPTLQRDDASKARRG